MSLELVQLGPATFHRLRELDRTPGQPDRWVAEVEDFILGPGVGSHFDEPASHILLAVHGEQVIGAVIHHPDDLPGAEYISAVLVDHRKRGQGYGKQLLAAAIEHAITASNRQHALWVVHPDNAPMIKLSEAAGELVGAHSSGYLVFVHP